ncbi:hypothetical protein ACFYPT_40270 [Streptomyces sp. NPDC005529]|uniref:hypothetical protein n=1 Tax=unclassified Streptomyces TaxID=2593676 RepID=UPI0033B53CEF
MGAVLRLSGTAFLTTGAIDPADVGTLAAAIIRNGHAFEMTPTRQGDGWRVEIQIQLEGDRSVKLIEELKQTFLFTR